jgi:hypothetical protein
MNSVIFHYSLSMFKENFFINLRFLLNWRHVQICKFSKFMIKPVNKPIEFNLINILKVISVQLAETVFWPVVNTEDSQSEP